MSTEEKQDRNVVFTISGAVTELRLDSFRYIHRTLEGKVSEEGLDNPEAIRVRVRQELGKVYNSWVVDDAYAALVAGEHYKSEQDSEGDYIETNCPTPFPEIK